MIHILNNSSILQNFDSGCWGWRWGPGREASLTFPIG